MRTRLRSLASTAAAADQRIRNGGRHRCQPPLTGFALLVPFRFIPVRFSRDQRPAKRCVTASAGSNPATVWSAPFRGPAAPGKPFIISSRSEEHTSELQSLMRISYAVFCLQKKNIHEQQNQKPTQQD